MDTPEMISQLQAASYSGPFAGRFQGQNTAALVGLLVQSPTDWIAVETLCGAVLHDSPAPRETGGGISPPADWGAAWPVVLAIQREAHRRQVAEVFPRQWLAEELYHLTMDESLPGTTGTFVKWPLTVVAPTRDYPYGLAVTVEGSPEQGDLTVTVGVATCRFVRQDTHETLFLGAGHSEAYIYASEWVRQ